MIDEHMDYLVSTFKSYLRKKLWIFAKLINDKIIRAAVKHGAYEQYLKETNSSSKQIEHFDRIRSEMTGLECVVLNNPNSTHLLSSDRPVLLLNPFLQRKKVNFGKEGMFQMGILLILPISSEKLLLCYDPDIYENPHTISSGKLSENDVEKLNRLQIQCGVEVVYSRFFPPNIKSLVDSVLNQKKLPQIIAAQRTSTIIVTGRVVRFWAMSWVSTLAK